MSATAAIKRAALELGFDAVGIARAEPLTEEHERYSEWIRRGYHATMGYMERNAEVRRDPGLILPGAKSVIVVARNYYTPYQRTNGERGKIARYAWGDDYHEVLPPMLDALCAAIKEIVPQSETKRYTDTGPIPEKVWAARAGIGWMGKNGNILRRDIGSWFFLGVVITTAEFDVDNPVEDYCGTCTACMDKCPTQAIVSPAVIDSNKCISYWTIEAKPDVDIPLNIVDTMDGWLFGCDVCQDVCPWNRFATPTTEVRFEPREMATYVDPANVVDLQPARFRERFRGSPLKRPKLAGLQRNAAALLRKQPPQTQQPSNDLCSTSPLSDQDPQDSPPLSTPAGPT